MKHDIRSKRAISAAELRGFAQATFTEERSRLRPVLMALAVLVPAGGVYAWRTGALSSSTLALSSKFSLLPAVLPESSSSDPFARALAVSNNAARDVKVIAKAPAPPQEARQETRPAKFETLAYAAKAPMAVPAAAKAPVVAKPPAITNVQVVASPPVAPKPPVVVAAMPAPVVVAPEDDDIAAVCQRSVNLYTPNGQPTGMVAGPDREAEHLNCLLTRKPERLCEAEAREALRPRFMSYSDAMKSAAGALAGRNAAAGQSQFQVGIHKQVREEMKKLAARGLLRVADFGGVAPDFIKATIGSVKATQSDCVKTPEARPIEPHRPAVRGSPLRGSTSS